MTKDTCHCGSGLEEKNCCGKTNVIEMNHGIYNEDLEELHKKLVTYALDNFHDLFIDQTERAGYNLTDETNPADQTFFNGMILWMILNYPVFDGVKTIFDVFYQQQKNHIKHTRTRKVFEQWGGRAPSLYEIVSIDQDDTKQAIVKDVITEEEFSTPIEENGFKFGSIIIGTLVPYVGYNRFFFSMIEIYTNAKEKVFTLYEEFLNQGKKLNNHFPDFLSIILENEGQLEWENELYEEVATQFSSHMVKKEIPEETILIGVLIWNEFCKKKHPPIKNVAANAASLEYFFQVYILENDFITQKKLAEEYQTTAGAISANYRKILASVEEELFKEDPTKNTIHETIDPPQEENNYEDSVDILRQAQSVHGQERKKLIKKALAINPYDPKAYLLLAQEAYDDTEYGRLLLQAIEAGEKELGKAFFLENKGSFWGIIETRSYMRAKEIYANYLDEIGHTDAAIKHAEDLLTLNPNDNQGIRYMLVQLYIETGQIDKAQMLFTRYDDYSTNFMFNKVLVSYLIDGITPSIKGLIKEAEQHNSFVKDFLTGTKEIPDEDIEIDEGEEFEAAEYVDVHGYLWDKHPNLIKLL